MTRLIKLIMVATIVTASVAQAQLFDEDYSGGSAPAVQAYNTSNGVEFVSNTGLTISNSAAVFEYDGTASVTNTEVAFTVIPVLNDAIPTDVDGAAVVFWVGTDSNVYRLVTGGTTVSNNINVVNVDGSVDFFVKINYVDHTFSLRVNGTDFDSSTVIFTDAPFYDDTVDQLSALVIRETSDSDVAVVELFEVEALDASGQPTAADEAALKVYEKGGKVYVELEVATDGASTSFDVFRDGVKIGTITYVAGQTVYTIEDATAVVGQTYNYSVTDFEDGTPVGEFDAIITVRPVLEAKAFEMTQTQMTLTFASVPGETYKVIGLTALIDGTSSVVEDDIVADSYETSVLVEIGDNFYFQIIKK